ncbi:MAG: flavin reductase family protein [Gammaproteobacteria bacterium]|nr:flavin reductase family protein [Gammaproteobacteria bacterium]
MADIDIGAFWGTIGSRATGATIVAARGSAGPAGFLGLSATHVTASPPTMLVSVDKKTSALAAIVESRHFAISFLSRDAEDVVTHFGGKTDLKGADRFETGRWTELATGAPVYVGAVGAIDCELEETIERHGTVIALGRVVALTRNDEAAPLIYFRGGFLA